MSPVRAPVPQALLPGWLRWPAAVLLATCAAVTAALAVHFAGQDQPGRLDAAIDPRIRAGLGHFPRLLSWLPDLGALAPVALVVLALVFACAVTRRWSGAALTAVAVPAAIGLTEYVLKPVVGRGLGQSLPSGHATAMFALAATCAVLLANPPRPRLPRAVRLLLVAGAVLVAAAVPVAMVALGFHYFTDIVAGAALGTGTVLLAALLIDLARPAARAPHGMATEDTAALSAGRLP